MKTSMRFDLVDLRLFLSVVEAASITHGAERAGMALASASERIRLMPDLDSRTGFRHREWQKCWRLIKPGRKCGAKL